LARGVDHRVVMPDVEAKSISVEETYDRDLEGGEVIETALLAHSQRLAARLHRSGLAARTVSLKLRFADFTTVTRSITSGQVIDGARDLYVTAIELLGQVEIDRPVRLLGLGGSGLEPADEPRQIAIGAEGSWSRVDEAVAGIRQRFGEHSVEPARLLRGPGPGP
ncbi:MAG: DNA polymerase IV, partial [Acidimicrobiia bacterium]